MSSRKVLLRRRIEIAEANLLDSAAKAASSAETGILLDIDWDEVERQRETLERLKDEQAAL